MNVRWQVLPLRLKVSGRTVRRRERMARARPRGTQKCLERGPVLAEPLQCRHRDHPASGAWAKWKPTAQVIVDQFNTVAAHQSQHLPRDVDADARVPGLVEYFSAYNLLSLGKIHKRRYFCPRVCPDGSECSQSIAKVCYSTV